jgi:hypothetical protein
VGQKHTYYKVGMMWILGDWDYVEVDAWLWDWDNGFGH